jgi:hypothetical protein
MKKTLTVMTLLAGAMAAYSQGLVNSLDYGSSFEAHIYNVQTSAPTGNVTAYTTVYGGYTSGTEYTGNVSNDQPAADSGNAVYNTGTALTGSGFDAQLLGAANTGDALSTLSTLGNIYNFYTLPGLQGLFSGGNTTTIPGSTPGTVAEGGNGATIALAVWANSGAEGSATTLRQAQQDGYAWGISQPANVSATGGVPPTGLPVVPPPMVGVDSFSLGGSLEEVVPEPSTIVLGLMSASALLFRRRK